MELWIYIILLLSVKNHYTLTVFMFKVTETLYKVYLRIIL